MQQKSLTKTDIENMYTAFQEEIPLFMAFSESERLKLFLRIMQNGWQGISVKEIASLSHLSRPAVSHHLKVLKDSGLITARKEGTKIFYSVDRAGHLTKLKENLAVLERGFAQMDIDMLQENSGEIASVLENLDK